MTPGLDGFARLGSVAAGAGGGQEVYMDALGDAYRVQGAQANRDKARSEARILQIREIARQGLSDSLKEAGYAPFQANILQSNPTVNVNQLGKAQFPGSVERLGQAALDLQGGNVAEYNDKVAMALGQQRTPYSAVGGGKAVFRTDTGEIELTDLGKQALATQVAQTGAAQARAVTTRQVGEARQSLLQRTDPNRSRATTPPKAGEVVDGYRFVGGDPSRRENWEKL